MAEISTHMLIAAGVRPDIAVAHAPHLIKTAAQFAIRSREQIAGFIGQGLHESALLTTFSERMSYSAERLMVVWPSRFPTHQIADQYARNPEKLANFVYGGRKDLGNGLASSGDGFAFRGSGLLQITGRANFTAATKDLSVDYVTHSDWPRTMPEHACLIGGWYWHTRGLNTLITTAGIDACSKKINPYQGKDELDRRHHLYSRCFALLTD